MGKKPKFYKDLFSNKDDPDKVGEIGNFLNEGENNYPKLTEAEAEEIERHLTADELLRTLKNTKNDTVQIRKVLRTVTDRYTK